MEVERRSYDLSKVEIRSLEDGKISFRGLAATYDSWSKDLGGFVERVTPTAFSRAVNEGQDVPFLVNHDPNLFLGRTGTGTITIRNVPGEGLWVEAEDLPDTQAARDLKALGGEVRSMSFGFKVPKGGDEWNWKASPAERSLLDVELRDVSVLTGATPAYNETTAEVRALLDEHRDYSTAERVALAKKGQAIPVKNDQGEVIDGRYPIANTSDLGNAIQAFGRASDKAEVKAWIMKRARALGATSQLPDDWRALDDLIAEAIVDVSERMDAFLSLEFRAGAVLSSKSKQRVTDAMQAMRDAHTHLENLMAEAGDSEVGVDTMDAFDTEAASVNARRRQREIEFERALGWCADMESEHAEREPAQT